MLNTTIHKCLNYLQVLYSTIWQTRYPSRILQQYESLLCDVVVRSSQISYDRNTIPDFDVPYKERCMFCAYLKECFSVSFFSNNYFKFYPCYSIKTNVRFKEYYRYMSSPVNYYLLYNNGWKFCQGCQYIIQISITCKL